MKHNKEILIKELSNNIKNLSNIISNNLTGNLMNDCKLFEIYAKYLNEYIKVYREIKVL